MSDLAQPYRTYHGAERNEAESSRRDRPIKQYGLRTDDRDAKSQNNSGYRDLNALSVETKDTMKQITKKSPTTFKSEGRVRIDFFRKGTGR